MRRFLVPTTLIVVIATLILTVSTSARERSGEEGIEPVLDRFDAVQSAIRTMSGRFVWTTESPLLEDPVVSSGRFYMTKPDAIRWEFTTPEEMAFVIAEDVYTGYFPARKKAEKRDFRRWSERLFRYFGVGQTSKELSKVYRIRLGAPDPDAPGHHVLDMEPRKRRARKRIENVRIWVDATTDMPTRIRTVGTDGSRREVRFEDVVVNPDLSAALFRIDLPDDVEVTDGAGSLGAFDLGAAGESDAP